MTEERMVAQLPAEVIREDRDLEQSMESAGVALAHLRWQWTLDETNVGRISVPQYATQVGVHRKTIHTYVNAYLMFVECAGTCTFYECVERAAQSAETRMAAEAVASTNHISFQRARKAHKEEVKQVKDAVENEAERREEQGRDFAAEERAEYARKIAEQKKIAREREERERIERQRKQGAQFIQADAHLSKARRELREALGIVQETEFSKEEVELLTREQAAIQGILGLIGSALQGDSGTDWDAELAALENRRQNG